MEALANQPKYTYGGQAVIEGVMIRGRSHFSLAVRRQDGTIAHRHEPLNTLFLGKIRQVPLVRGVLVLIETLMLGTKTLHQSSSMAMEQAGDETEEAMPAWLLAATLAFSLTVGIGIFFVMPLLLIELMDPFIASDMFSNIFAGLIRLAILLGYIWGIGFLKDVKRVYAYHGAEHMAVHAYEAGLPLTVENVNKFGTPHPRCGTAFLLTVVLVSLVAFAFLGRPDLWLRIIQHLALIAPISGISYEIIRFSGVHQTWWSSKQMARPGLLLQRLTTRQPDDDQVEVAICAMAGAIAADNGEEYSPVQTSNSGTDSRSAQNPDQEYSESTGTL